MMAELRRVQNENISDASMVSINPSSKRPEQTFKNEPMYGYGSKVVLDVQVMELKNLNYHLEREKSTIEKENQMLKDHVQHYKSKAEEWKTKCYKEGLKYKNFELVNKMEESRKKISKDESKKEDDDKTLLGLTKRSNYEKENTQDRSEMSCVSKCEVQEGSEQNSEDSIDNQLHSSRSKLEASTKEARNVTAWAKGCQETSSTKETRNITTWAKEGHETSSTKEARETSRTSSNTLSSRNSSDIPPSLKHEKAFGKENTNKYFKKNDPDSEECKVQ